MSIHSKLSQKNKSSHNQGFTLIELMVVIAIIGILTAVSFISFSASMTTARKAALKDTMNGIQIAMYADVAKEPNKAEGLAWAEAADLALKADDRFSICFDAGTGSCKTSPAEAGCARNACAAIGTLGDPAVFAVCVDMAGTVTENEGSISAASGKCPVTP